MKYHPPRSAPQTPGFGAFHQGKVNPPTSKHATSEKRPHSDEERLEEGLRETFPASDPVSAKHIT